MMAHTTASVLSNLLVDEASTGRNDSDGWNAVVNSYVMNLLKIRRMENLDHPTRLAIAIAIVGSERLELYTIAFRLLCDWEHINGPYWVVQEEILRFAAIYLFRRELENEQADKSVITMEIRKQLPEILPNDLPPYIGHETVKKRIHFLRTEFKWLLDDIRRGPRDRMKTIFEDYTNQFPLDRYVPWFLEWAQDLLFKFQALIAQRSSDSQSHIDNVRSNMRGNLQPEYQQITEIATAPKIATETVPHGKRPRIDRSFNSPIGDSTYVGAVSCEQNQHTATAKSVPLLGKTVRMDSCPSKYPRLDFEITPSHISRPTESSAPSAPHNHSKTARTSSSPLTSTLKITPPLERTENCREIVSPTNIRQENDQSFKKLKINTTRAIFHHPVIVSLEKYLASRGSHLSERSPLNAPLPDAATSPECIDTRCEEKKNGLINDLDAEIPRHDHACKISKPKYTTLLQSLLPFPPEGNINKTNQKERDTSTGGDNAQEELKSNCEGNKNDEMSPLSGLSVEASRDSLSPSVVYEFYESDDEKRGVLSNIAHSVWGLFSPTKKVSNT